MIWKGRILKCLRLTEETTNASVKVFFAYTWNGGYTYCVEGRTRPLSWENAGRT